MILFTYSLNCGKLFIDGGVLTAVSVFNQQFSIEMIMKKSVVRCDKIASYLSSVMSLSCVIWLAIGGAHQIKQRSNQVRQK